MCRRIMPRESPELGEGGACLGYLGGLGVGGRVCTALHFLKS